MKKISFSHNSVATKFTVAVLCTQDKLPNTPSKAFEGKYLETVLLYGKSKNILYIGVGKENDLDALSFKELGGTISKLLGKEKVYDFSVDSNAITGDYSFYVNLVQGLALGTYTYSLKSEKVKEESWNIEIVGEGINVDIKKAIEEGFVLAEGVSFARDVTNMPSNHLRPADYVEKIKQLLTPLGVEIEVLAGEEIAKKGLNGLFLIGDSSGFPPQFVVMRYKGARGRKIALVGKGITFDTGGYNVKVANFMEDMQGDMGGSAAVVGALFAIAKTRVKANVVGIISVAENKISPSSLVPGDVYTAYDGQTVEILNTDAEGRLVLADAVAYAVKDEKAAMVLDAATLTGAAVRALGYGVTATVANDDEIWENIEKAGLKSGERFMRFPVYPEYKKMLDSNVADMKNIGDSEAGAITGGIFIGNFVGKTPWIHLDIAGPSWVNKPLFAHQSKGATGTLVDTFYYFCQDTK